MPKKQFTLKKNVIAMSKDRTTVPRRSGATNGSNGARGFRRTAADISDLDILDSAISATAVKTV